MRRRFKYIVPKDQIRALKKETRKEAWIWFSMFCDRELIRKVRSHLKKLAYAGCKIDFKVNANKVDSKYKAYSERFDKALKVISPSIPKVKICKLQHPRHYIDDMCFKADNPKAILKAVGRNKTSAWVKDSKEVIKQFDNIG